MRLQELAAESAAGALGLAVPHADLDGLEALGVIGRAYREHPAHFDRLWNRYAQSASGTVEHPALHGFSRRLNVGNEDRDRVAAAPE